MSYLASLPLEMLHSVFREVNPNDLPALSATCRLFHTYISNNRQLFKDIYLNYFVSASNSILCLEAE